MGLFSLIYRILIFTIGFRRCSTYVGLLGLVVFHDSSLKQFDWSRVNSERLIYFNETTEQEFGVVNTFLT